MRQEKYRDRMEAGEVLADLLAHYASSRDLVLLALPRGGIPVAYPIAKRLHIPLYPYIVRKLGAPGFSELAIGAIALNGAVVFNQAIIQELHISQEEIDAVMRIEQAELKRRQAAYLAGISLPTFQDKTVILVDDGIATGATVNAAIAAIKTEHPARIVLATPVCPESLSDDMRAVVDDFICPLSVDEFDAVGKWYDAFPAVEDDDVNTMIAACAAVNNKE